MKIVACETLRTPIQPNLCFVRLHTDTGLIGLGETFYGAPAVESYLHAQLAPELLGRADPGPEQLAPLLQPYTGYQGGGVETRAAGAVDIALWDLLAQRAQLPLVDLWGGRVRDAVPVYNTCAGTDYVKETGHQHSDNWGLTSAPGRYEDLQAFLHRPGELARELRDEGIGGMKIWPFDQAAERSGGQHISPAELAHGIDIVAEIRRATGDDMKLMIELHGLWAPGPAGQICAALSPHRPTWVEDPVRPDAVHALETLRRMTDVPIATGETVVGRRGFLPLLESGVVDVVTVDPSWTGGATEARKVAALAETFGVSVAPHDCTGPVSLAVGTHLVCGQPGGLIQETARAFTRTWYRRVATGVPDINDGTISPTRQPGHGVRLSEELLSSPETARRLTHADAEGALP